VNILILSDGFVREDLVQPILTKHLGAAGGLRFDCIRQDWPLSPFVKNSEISEYQGSEEAIIPKIGEADVVILHASPITERVLAAAGKLQAIGVIRGGPTNVNLKAATRRGIPVFNTPGRNAVAVVEFTVGLILAEIKNIARAHMYLKQQDWRYDYYLYSKCNFELAGKTAGLVGFGNIAWRLSSILKSFGMQVIAYDPYVTAERMAELGVAKVDFDRLLAESDVVSVHARLTPETAKMFNKAAFAKMKPTALLVNTARGGLVDYEDLTEALEKKVIACAALDVFESEPADMKSRLFQLENVTLTPHIAGATRDTVSYGMNLLGADLAAYFGGRPPAHCLNPETLKMKSKK